MSRVRTSAGDGTAAANQVVTAQTTGRRTSRSSKADAATENVAVEPSIEESPAIVEPVREDDGDAVTAVTTEGDQAEMPCPEPDADTEAPAAEGAELLADSDVEEETTTGDKKKAPKPPSNKKLSLELLKNAKADFAKKGISFSQGNIIKLLGGSFSTVGNLMRELDSLQAEPFNLDIVLSVATQDAIKLDIQHHVETYRDSINAKLEKIENAKSTMAEAVATIKKLQDAIAKHFD